PNTGSPPANGDSSANVVCAIPGRSTSQRQTRLEPHLPFARSWISDAARLASTSPCRRLLLARFPPAEQQPGTSENSVTFPDARQMADRAMMPTRPGDFHPEPLTDPDLSLSPHPALAIARKLPPSVERRVLPGEPVGPNQRR